ncbi:peptide chain release factor 2 [Candidatus Sumerlaeota bacterium]|nr:peptide chain release factor 2 [Candidatus Sumerlaeota bacterium]
MSKNAAPLKPEETLPALREVRERIARTRDYLNLTARRTEIETLEKQTAEAGFWDKPEIAQAHMRKIKALKSVVEPWEAITRECDELLELHEMSAGDEAMMTEICAQSAALRDKLEGLELRTLMTDVDDPLPCFVYIHAGAGGTESCDWASMLLRMYTRWCERSGLAVELIDVQEGEEAGIRSATLLVRGEYAYGYLKGEEVVHRLVRISPFDANKRRHTSFCAVDVYPEVDDNIEVDIRDEDLKIDTYRSSGAGGQHVNKTSSAVRITHLPTKIVVQCQNERSQHKNKATAMKMLRSKLYQHFLRIQEEKIAAKESEKKAIAWGSQIRSYVFQPYMLVKDNRTDHETGNVPAVMDGDLDEFIESYLRWRKGMDTGAVKKY